MDFIYRFTKPMRSNPKMGKENPEKKKEKKSASGCGRRKKRSICKNHEESVVGERAIAHI
jgi:hypothetical protein